MEKKALGKGLQALLPEKKTLVWKVEQDGQAISLVPLKQIIPNRYQPRTIFVEDELEGLAQSIKEHGVLQPIVVRRKGDGVYELIAGERRFRAAVDAPHGLILVTNNEREFSRVVGLGIENWITEVRERGTTTVRAATPRARPMVARLPLST